MTMDDESSIYVGGLPYDATEDTIRTVFNLYGAILDVKIINDQRTRGKCYCFVTFTNHRSAIDAINDMNGRTIDGRVVKVSGVKSRGGRSNFGRERYYHNNEKNGDWDRSRGRDRDYDLDKDGHRNRRSDWNRERERSRERDRSRDHDPDRDRRFDHVHDYDQPREQPLLDIDWGQEDNRVDNEQENIRAHFQDAEIDHNLHLDIERKMDRTSDPDNLDEDRNEESRRRNGLSVPNRHSMDLSSDSNGNHNDQAEDQIEKSTKRLDQLKKEVSQMEQESEKKRNLVMDLQMQSRKLEDALINAKKHTLYRQMQLTKLHKGFLQVKDCTERLKTCEKELQAQVDNAILEIEGDGVGLKDGQLAIESLDGR